MKPTHFLTLNATTGRGRLTPLVTNKPKPKPSGCGCGTCRPRSKPPARTPEPFDPTANAEHALRLEREADEAERAGNEVKARELRDRALLVHDLNEAHDREAARREATLAEVRQRRRPGILTGPGEGSVLDQK